MHIARSDTNDLIPKSNVALARPVMTDRFDRSIWQTPHRMSPSCS